MGSIVTRDELKTKLGIVAGDNSLDAQLDLAILQTEGEFESGIGQKLIATDYTEYREGNGKTYLQLRFYPFVDLASVVIENESAIDVGNLDVIRVSDGTDGLPWLTFVDGRRFSCPRWRRVPNITIVYGAGYENQADVKAALPDVWSGVLEHAYILHLGNDTRKKAKASESFMGQSYSQFLEPIDKSHDRDWKRLIEKYRRRPITRMAARALTTTAKYGVW
jgi:hypothetical protein